MIGDAMAIYATTKQQSLLAVLAQFPDGASMEQLERGLIDAPHRRTLQRWLNTLIEQQQVLRLGQGRASRYVLSANKLQASPKPVDKTERYRLNAKPATLVAQESDSAIPAENKIPLSSAALEIEALVRRPLVQRQPVGYNRQFLDSYRPNVTFYLSQDVRESLFAQGQAASADQPAGTYARQLASRLLIDLSWNSSRLEGNTYSLLETERLLSAGEVASGKNVLDAQMILNHKQAIEFLIDSASEIGFNRYTVLNLHALLSDNLLDDPAACGRLRSIAVGIGRTTFVPLEGPQLIAECFDQILDTAAAIHDPFEQAFFCMVHLPYLQPFEDVNKRVSRLSANIPLIQRNLCPLSFVDVSQSTYISAMLGVYELNRIEFLRELFIWAYQRSCARYSAVRQTLGEPDVFRMQHREAIAEVVAAVVRDGCNKEQAIAYIHQFAAQHLAAPLQHRFIETVETQLLNLHEGSIARYRIKPSEFYAWQKNWV